MSVVSQISYKQSCEFDPEDSSPSSENSGGTEQKLKKRHALVKMFNMMYVCLDDDVSFILHKKYTWDFTLMV